MGESECVALPHFNKKGGLVLQVSSTPEVIHTMPKAYSVDLDASTLTQIKLGFNTDIDVNSLDGNVIVYDEYSNVVDGKINYQNRILSYTFSTALKSGHTYRVLVRGDSEAYVKGLDNGNGIRSVMGVYMPKDYDYTLSTMAADIPQPRFKTPSHYSTVKTQPIFSWTAIKDADEYELEVSRSNRFRPLVIPEGGLEGMKLVDTEFQWNKDLPDGTYYARVRARVDALWGSWSDTIQFNIDTVDEGYVSNDDEDLDDHIEHLEPIAEVVDMYPKLFESQISTKLPGVAFRILGDYDPTKITMSMMGAPIDNEEDEGLYENVSGTLEFVNNPDGTTWVIFKPTPIGG